MASSSIRGGERAPTRPSGTDIDSLGPSDSTDSGSDVQHQRRMPTEADNAAELGAMPSIGSSTSDAFGTGERESAIGDVESTDGNDITPDRIERMPGAGDADTGSVEGTAGDSALDEVDGLAVETDEEGSEESEDDPAAGEAQRTR